MRGFSLLGVVITIAIIGVLSTSIPLMLAEDQNQRTQQWSELQGYYATKGAMEFALSQINEGGNPTTLPTRYFMGARWNYSRTGGKIYVTLTLDNDAEAYSLTDPNPPEMAAYLIVNTSSAARNHKVIQGITLQRNSSGPTTLTISSMVFSWSGDTSDYVNSIIINGTTESSANCDSGQTCTLSPTFSLTGTTVYPLTSIQFNTVPTGTPITIQFYMSDGSSTSVSVTVS